MATYDPRFDLNHDGCITVADLELMKPHYGARRGAPNYDPALDFDGDGVISILDLLQMASRVGTCAQASSITEPPQPMLFAAFGVAAGVLLYGLYASRPQR